MRAKVSLLYRLKQGKNKMELKRKSKANIFIAGMLLIPVAHFAVFWVAVNFNSILLAFQQLDDAGNAYFTFDNFRSISALFSKFGELRISLVNTLITWVFLVSFLLPWGFLLTYFLYKKIKLSGLWRTMLFVPALLPAVAMTSIFMYITLPGGPVGKLAGFFTEGGAPAFLNDAKYARWTIIFYIFLTNFGGQFILFSGAMSRVPKEVIESAHIDGAGMRTELLRIVLPLCWPTISMLLLLNLAGIFTASGPVLLLTGGKVDTSTMSYYFFNSTRFLQYHVPAAVGIFFTLLLFPVVLLARWGLSKVYANVEF